MGVLLSLPLAGSLGTIASSCLGGIAFCFASTTGELEGRMCFCPYSNICMQRPCFSSHATATPLLQLVLDSRYVISSGVSVGSILDNLDDICLELYAGLAHEDAVCHTTDREMELRLYQDGLC
jgi:hypothetical protein